MELILDQSVLKETTLFDGVRGKAVCSKDTIRRVEDRSEVVRLALVRR